MIDWQPIDSAPTVRDANGHLREVLLIATYPNDESRAVVWTDVVHSWWDTMSWTRWRHCFPPTHWAPINTP